jgi:hypothetical protein
MTTKTIDVRDFEPKLNRHLVVEDVDRLIDLAHDALQHPSDSAWRDGDLWDTHTLMFATPDPELTDEYLSDYSNYRSVLRDLQKAYPDDVEDASFGHWTYSRFVAIKIRVIDDEGYLTPAFIEAIAITDDFEHNHLYDEGDYMELETEAIARIARVFAEDNNLDPELIFDAMDEQGAFFYIDGYYEGDTETLIERTRELMAEQEEQDSTWYAHNYGTAEHSLEHCWYCNRDKEVN